MKKSIAAIMMALTAMSASAQAGMMIRHNAE